MEFVKLPYLPKGKTLFGVGDVVNKYHKSLMPFRHKVLPPALKLHGDLTFCYLGDGVAVCAPEAFDYYKKSLEGLMLIKGETFLDRHYPLDAAYNVATVGKRIFCKKDTTDSVLLSVAEKMGYKIINMKQGYGKCSVCPVSETSAISADPSFIKAAEKEGVEVLQITNKTIFLPSYPNGFFGGAAYMYDEKTLLINGEINLHPDCDRIKAFLEKRGITPVCLNKENVRDFGSFSPIWEE